MKVLSLFSGIGAFEKALDNKNIAYGLVAYCEVDKYASKSYAAIHNVTEEMNLGDITKVNEKELPKDIDLVTYGFPCQDISLAGKQKGLFNEDGSQTRSGLFFEALRIIEETKPKVAIAENVKNLVGKKFKEQFGIVLDSLDKAGYNNRWCILNAKDFGIPQNRERVFIISIRKDIDTGMFQFPEGFPLELRLKDMLEDEVDEKFYISDKQIKNINITDRFFEIHRVGNTISGGERSEILGTDGICSCLTATDYKQPKQILDPILIGGMQKHQSIKTDGICTTLTSSMGTGGGYVPMITEPIVKQIGNCCPTKTRENPNQGRIYDKDGLSPSLNCMEGGNRQPFVVVNTNNSKGYDIAEVGDYINIERPNSTTRRGRVGHGVSQCLDTKENHCVVTAEPTINVIGNYSPSGHDASRIVSADGLAPTVKENHGTVTATVVADPSILKVGNIYPSGGQNGNIYSEDGISPTIASGVTNTKGNGGIGSSNAPKILQQNLRIRKLTPKECFRLQGFSDEDFAKAEKVCSNTQLYKQAGNSICVPVIEHIYESLTESGVWDVEEN